MVVTQSRWQDRRLQELIGAAALWVLGMVAEHALELHWLAVTFFLAAIVLSGYRIARAARLSLSVRRADMNLLMTTAAIGAIILGDFSEASSLVVLFAVGVYLQSATLDRTRGAIKALLDLTPPTARLVRDGQETSVQAIALQPGDVIRVLPGERIPVDGTITERPFRSRSGTNHRRIEAAFRGRGRHGLCRFAKQLGRVDDRGHFGR